LTRWFLAAFISTLAQILVQAAGLSVAELDDTNAELIPAVVLKKQAVVYVRQSTQSQIMTNLESKRRQYDLARGQPAGR